ILITAKPIKIAHEVAQKKYSIDFQAIRPTCFKSECPAIPYTNVAKIIGATMVLTNLMNPLLKGCSAIAAFGKSIPTKTPRIIQTIIQVVRFFLINAFTINTNAVDQRRPIIRSGETEKISNSYKRVIIIARVINIEVKIPNLVLNIRFV